MSVIVTDKDLGWKKISEESKKLDGSYALVGIQSEEGGEYPDGGPLTLAEIGVANEFGVEIKGEDGQTVTRIPERSFMRAPFDKKRRVLLRFMRHQVRQVKAGKLTAAQAVGQLGEFGVRMIKEWIGDRSNFVPNAPSTIAKKTRDGKVGDSPLIDTSNMLGSIRSKPVVGDGK